MLIRFSFICVLFAIAFAPGTARANASSHDSQIHPVPFYEVKVEDHFWKNRIALMNEVTVPFGLDHGQRAINRLRQCADFRLGKSKELPFRHRFISSDLYKTMEAAAYSLEYDRNPEIESLMDSVIAIIGAAQQDDGYLYVDHICKNPNLQEEGPAPYSKHLASHELYNMGHLYEAATAYYHATGKDALLKIAEKSARHINEVFFVGGNPAYNSGKPVNISTGHEEIEIALCKLYRTTGNKLYLDMARKFIDIRGVTYVGDKYGQHHLPVRKQRTAEGHAVRAGYLYYAMALMDGIDGTDEYTKALHAIWNNIVSRKMHITGGLGAVHQTEGFGADYDLPNKNAYNETCAAVANVFFNQQMFLNEGKSEYIDILEASLFNCAMAGISVGGTRFFYENPLECDGIRIFNKGGNYRDAWFDCACCPPNIMRLILQTPGYFYAHTDDTIFLNLYAGSSTTVALEKGIVHLHQTSDYPWRGDVALIVEPERTQQRFKLNLRIPTWARTGNFLPGKLYSFADRCTSGFEIYVNGNKTACRLKDGYAVIDREWKKGDRVQLRLPVESRYVSCDVKVVDNHHRLAVTRGPLVYCAEQVDNPVEMAQQLYFKEGMQKLETDPEQEDMLKGMIKLSVPAGKVENEMETPVELQLSPYFLWGNRKPGNTMTVWIPEDAQTARESIPGHGYLDVVDAVTATSCDNRFPVRSLCDGGIGSGSREMTTPFWSSEGMGVSQEVVLTFKEKKKLSALSVYWTDRSEGERFINCHVNKVPSAWRVEYRKDGKWIPMELYITDFYSVNLDKFNTVHPADELETDAVKLIIDARKGFTVGISEVQLSFEEE